MERHLDAVHVPTDGDVTVRGHPIPIVREPDRMRRAGDVPPEPDRETGDSVAATMCPGERRGSDQRQDDVLTRQPAERPDVALDEGDRHMSEDPLMGRLIPHIDDVGICGTGT